MRTGVGSSKDFQKGTMRPRLPCPPERFVIRFKSHAAARKLWTLLESLFAIGLFPGDVWVNYNTDLPNEVMFGRGELPPG